MYHYRYVTSQEAKPYRKEIIEIINKVQNLVREKFTFQYKFIGSSARNMITFDSWTNEGFDFDVNLYPNDEENNYSPKEIKAILMNAFNEVIPYYRFKPCEDSTRVITIKKFWPAPYQICYSCDFAVVNDYEDQHGNPHQEYVRFNKKHGSYIWEEQPGGYHLEEKEDWIKDNQLWSEVYDLYLNKKNNDTENKKSRSLYAETIHEVCQQNGYFR